MIKNRLYFLIAAALLVMPLCAHAEGADHGTIGGGPGSQGSVNLDAIFGGPQSSGPIVQKNDGTSKGIDAFDALDRELGGNPASGPVPSDSGSSNRSREFGHQSNLRTGSNPLPAADFAQLQNDFETEGLDGFRPDSTGGQRLISALSNQWNPDFGSSMPNDFIVLPTSSHEGSTYCGDDF